MYIMTMSQCKSDRWGSWHTITPADGDFFLWILDTDDLVEDRLSLSQLNSLYRAYPGLKVQGVRAENGVVSAVYYFYRISSCELGTNYALLYEDLCIRGSYARCSLVRRGCGVVAEFEVPHVEGRWDYLFRLEEKGDNAIIRVSLRSKQYTVDLKKAIVYGWDGHKVVQESMLTQMDVRGY